MAVKAGATIDLNALKVAGGGASKYITEIASDGIFISPSNQNPAESAEGNSIKINGSGMEIYKGGVSVAQYGDTARVGLEESSHLSILGNSISGIASNGVEYFEVSENGGSKTTTSYTNIFSSTTYVHPTRTVDLSSTTTSAKGIWLNITTGSPFRIKIEYFCRTAQTATARYDSRSYGFVKGTTLSTAYVDYNGTNTITIHGYPSIPSSALRFIGCRVYLGRNQTVTLPFYRFGEDVAESGCGYSFLTGRGTLSTNATWPQLVTGRYNSSDSNALFIVGNGTSDSARLNAFTVDDLGNVEAAGEITGATSKTVITTFSSGWDVYSTDPAAPVTLRRCGKFVDLTGMVKNTTAVTLNATQVTIFTIPEEYRPSQTMTILSQGSSMNVFAIRIKASGDVTFERYRSTNSTSTSYSSISEGTWFPIHAAWIMD